MNQKLGKSQIVTTLNKLVEQNRVIEKNCGKQKIYCVAQKSSALGTSKETTVLEIERQNSSLALKLKDVEDQLEKKRAQLRQFEAKPTKNQLLQKKQDLEDEIKQIREQLKAYPEDTYDKTAKDKIEREYRAVLKEYNKRRKMCTEMVDAIFENYPKTKKHLLQEIGIETDDDVGFKVKVQIK